MDGNETKIECICRRYRVQAADGSILEVEPIKLISGRINYRLFEEEKEISAFFSKHKVVVIGQKTTMPEKYQKEVKSTERSNRNRIRLNPMQRLNCMTKMKGDFTREDYQKHMLDKYSIGVSIFMSHGDMEDALKARKLEIVDKKSGRLRKYRVIDSSEFDESSYKSLVKGSKIQIEAKQ